MVADGQAGGTYGGEWFRRSRAASEVTRSAVVWVTITAGGGGIAGAWHHRWRVAPGSAERHRPWASCA